MTAVPPDYLRSMATRVMFRLVPMVIVITLWCLGFKVAAAAVFLTVFCSIAYVTLSPTTRLLGPIVTQVPGNTGVWVTLDDGPCPTTTLDVLDVLDRHQAKAVFFLIGSRVSQWPHLAQEIARRGHVVGNHSQTHPAGVFWTLGPRRMWQEIAECQASILAATGAAPTWFRAPVGHFNMFTHAALQRLGLRLMSWSSRGFDAVDPDVARVLRRLEPDLKPGAIVLLHEGRPGSTALLDGTLSRLREKGLSPTLPDAPP